MQTKEKRAVNTMRNNLNSARMSIDGAYKAQFILRELHRRTGMTQQALLSRCVNFCFNNDNTFAEYRKAVEEEWKEVQNL